MTTVATKQDFDRAVAEAMTEKELMQNILDCARTLGWRCYHTFDSRRSSPGFPDIIAIRGKRILAIECKREYGVPTPDQEDWLAAFRGIDAVAVLWRPHHWLQGWCEEILR